MMSAPASAILVLMSGSASTSLIATLSVATTSFGVPCGAKKPTHSEKSKSLMPAASDTVGTSGAEAERRRDGEHLHLARLDERDGGRKAGEIEVHVAAQEIAQRRPGTPVGHVGHVALA